MKLSAKKLVLTLLASGIITAGSAAFAADLSSWAVSDYNSANKSGLLSFDVVSSNLKDYITREEFCELVVNLYQNLTNEQISLNAPNPFEDVNNIAVTNAYYYGIVSGMSDTEFMPDRLVTRQEMAKMIVNTITSAEHSIALSGEEDFDSICHFTDNYKVADWAKPSVATLVNYNLMRGMTDTEFEPLYNSTVEQAISSINRAYVTFSESPSVYEIPYITTPLSGATIEDWQFSIKWNPVEGAQSYYIIIKDSNANIVYRANLCETEAVLSYSHLPNASYSVIVGAKFADNTESFSEPVDFTYNHISEEQRAALKAAEERETRFVPVAGTEKEQAVLNEAAKYLGIPYVWGGNSPADGGMDCSGFVRYVYSNLGYSIKRIADDQYKYSGTYVPRDQLRPGDLVFFGSGNYATHVGMYVGKIDGVDTMIHAPSTGKNIMYASIESSYYKTRYLGAKRILN